MNENIIILPRVCKEKEIGRTTYIVSNYFKGDKKHDIVKSIARLIERDIIQPV